MLAPGGQRNTEWRLAINCVPRVSLLNLVPCSPFSPRPRMSNPTLPPEVVSRFLDNACPDHHVRGGGDHIRAEHTALRLLQRYPEIAAADFYTAVVCGDIDAVTRALD